MEDDHALLALATSVTIPCGAHAGDPPAILNACSDAVRAGLAIGALVGYRDPFGGGRRFVDYSPTTSPPRSSISWVRWTASP